MSPAPGTRLGPYTLMAALGAGGMGEVYSALDTRLDRLVAVKVLPRHLASDPTARARFDREAKAIAGLNHPNVCALFDIGHDQGHDYLVLELLEGETLQERLQKGALDIGPLVTYGIALADALDAAHDQGLIHRDLKPANIFLTTRDIPKILDFGLAKAMDTDSDATRQSDAQVTTLGTTVGTLAYMSPEQLRGEVLDARTDLFSLGLVLYEMSTGQRAFTGQTTAVITAGILGQAAAPPRTLRPDLPPKLEDAILKAIEKDLSLRCQTAAELRADLLRIKREMSEGARTVTVSAVAATKTDVAPVAVTPPGAWNARASSSGRMFFLAGLGVLVLGVAGTAYLWIQRSATPPASSVVAVNGSGSNAQPAALPPPSLSAPPPVAPAPAPTSAPVTPPPASSTATSAPPVTTAPEKPVPPPVTTTTAPPRPTPFPTSSTPPPADARGNARPGSGNAVRGRGNRGPTGPAAANLITTLKGLPPQTYHIVFPAGNVQAHEFAIQLQNLLNAGGWTCTGVQPTQDATTSPISVGVPHQTASATALVNWATRGGLNPQYLILPRLKEVQITVGPPK